MQVVGQRCVLRVRYNTTSYDLPWDADASANGKVKKDPVSDWIGGGVERTGPLRLNIDTAQYFRTFEDRSHVFVIDAKASGIPWYAELYNFNVRGRRGNIVQTYPATEYDFQPTELTVSQCDYVHFQWAGCSVTFF